MRYYVFTPAAPAVLWADVVPFLPPQPFVVAASEPLATRKPTALDRAELAPARLPSVQDPAPNGELHSRSPGANRL